MTSRLGTGKTITFFYRVDSFLKSQEDIPGFLNPPVPTAKDTNGTAVQVLMIQNRLSVPLKN
jgi:hypothetical protein